MSVVATKAISTAKLLSRSLDAWYVAGWDHEITGRGIHSRTAVACLDDLTALHGERPPAVLTIDVP